IDLPKGVSHWELIESSPIARPAVVAAGKIEFQVQGELEVLPIVALAAVKAPGPNPDDPTIVGLEEVRQALEDNLGKSPDAVATYKTKLLDAPENGVLPEPTAIGLTVDRNLWIALLAPEAFAGTIAQAKASVPGLRAAIAGRVVSVGVRLDATLCGP